MMKQNKDQTRKEKNEILIPKEAVLRIKKKNGLYSII